MVVEKELRVFNCIIQRSFIVIVYCLTKETLQQKIKVVLFKQQFRVIMLKLINKIFSQYHVLKESQTLCSGTIKLAKTKVEI